MQNTDFDVENYRGWLYTLAYDLLGYNHSHLTPDDLVQEGRLAMLQSLETYNPEKGALPSWVTAAARQRMRDLVHGHRKETGHEAVRGVQEARASLSLDVEPGDTFGYEDDLFTVQDAAMHARVQQAVAALDPEARRYVYARFWLGLDPASRAEGTRALVRAVGGLTGREGTLTWSRARKALTEALSDFCDLQEV